MKKIRTIFGNYLCEMELSDFSIGDRVKYDGNGNAPKYLAEYNDLFVKKINVKNIKVGCTSFPNEFWNISPVHLKKVSNEQNRIFNGGN